MSLQSENYRKLTNLQPTVQISNIPIKLDRIPGLLCPEESLITATTAEFS